MIERIVERAEHGGIERILERTLTPLEETVERVWPRVKRGLLQLDIADRDEAEITIDNVPVSVDPRDLANALCDKIIAEPQTFAHATWRKLTFTVTPTGARRQ